LLILTLITPIQANTEINFSNIPTQLSEQLGIPIFAGQILASSILMFIPLLCISLLARGRHKHAWVAEMFTGFMFLSFSVALGWCPYWLLIILTLLVALMFAGQMRDLITGGSK